ncbi:MAG: type II toxin-antitoxin system prevent-host-death family antitoxin [Desulfobacterales bacterium]|nr:type II toxin-antitoxin system prevent-host-death family antitoxin [Desulfobacterales bacterium]
MIENSWQLQDAKNKFSSLVDKAQHNGPQVVTKHGKDAVVVLSIDEYKKLIKPKTSLLKFFQNSPLSKIKLDIKRNKDLPRDIEL